MAHVHGAVEKPTVRRYAAAPARAVSSRAAILALQRQAGNLAVSRAIAGCPAYEPGEVKRSRTPKGILDRDVSLAGSHQLIGVSQEGVAVSDFGVDRSGVKATTAAELRSEKWIDIMERQAGKRLEFVGYSDCADPRGTNQELRLARAQAVANLFPKAKAQASAIRAAAPGDFLTTDDLPDERALDRSVVIQVPGNHSTVIISDVEVVEDPHVIINMQEPASEGCDANQRTQLSIAFPAAKLMAEKAQKAVLDRNSVISFLLERYFGKRWNRHIPEIHAGFTTILSKWESWEKKFECVKQTEQKCPSADPHKVILAYVTTKGNKPYGQIRVCEAALKTAYDMQRLSATVLHELSHRLDNTNDRGGYFEEGEDRTISTETAVRNADSYAQFARKVFNTSI